MAFDKGFLALSFSEHSISVTGYVASTSSFLKKVHDMSLSETGLLEQGNHGIIGQ